MEPDKEKGIMDGISKELNSVDNNSELKSTENGKDDSSQNNCNTPILLRFEDQLTKDPITGFNHMRSLLAI